MISILSFPARVQVSCWPKVNVNARPWLCWLIMNEYKTVFALALPALYMCSTVQSQLFGSMIDQ